MINTQFKGQKQFFFKLFNLVKVKLFQLGVKTVPQSSSIIRASPLDCFVPYIKELFGGIIPSCIYIQLI